MEELNVPIFAQAKIEYTNQLVDILYPHLFDGIKSIYDKEVVKVLDNTTNYLDSFTTFQSKLTCKTKKYLTLENLSLDCE